MPATNRKNKRALLIALPLVIVLFPLGYSVVASLLAREAPSDGGDLFLEMPGAEHEACVRDTAYMRYHHWELLKQIREEVVRYGIRGDVGLNRCADCHTSRERFCNRCHEATSLYPDCFDCHYYP